MSGDAASEVPPERAGELIAMLRGLVAADLRVDLGDKRDLGDASITQRAWESCRSDAEWSLVLGEIRRIVDEVGHPMLRVDAPPTEMRLCEASNLVLHANQLYRFTVAPGCALCLAEDRLSVDPRATRSSPAVDDQDRVGELRGALRRLVTGALRDDLDGGERITKEAWEICADDAERDVVRREISRLIREIGHETPSCPIAIAPCPEHGIVHGKEAEDLRAGIEALIRDAGDPRDGEEAADLLRDLRRSLQALLDRVNAADSLGHLEARDR